MAASLASLPWRMVGVFSFLALAMAGIDELRGIPPPDANTEVIGEDLEFARRRRDRALCVA